MPTLWPFKPNGVVLERLEWMTDALESSSGVEQRIALRRVHLVPQAAPFKIFRQSLQPLRALVQRGDMPA